jgi:hypothetical protein
VPSGPEARGKSKRILTEAGQPPSTPVRLDPLPKRNLTGLVRKGIGSLKRSDQRRATSADELIAEVMGGNDQRLIALLSARPEVLSYAPHESSLRPISLYEAVQRSKQAAGGMRPPVGEAARHAQRRQ